MKGEVTGEDPRRHTTETIRAEKEEGLTKILIDVTELVIPQDLSFLDILSLAAKQYFEEDAIRDARIALFPSGAPEMQEAVSFYETAALNRSWKARACRTREEATAWLLDDRQEDLP